MDRLATPKSRKRCQAPTQARWYKRYGDNRCPFTAKVLLAGERLCKRCAARKALKIVLRSGAATALREREGE